MNWTELLKSEIDTTYATTARLLDRVDPDGLGWKPETGGNCRDRRLGLAGRHEVGRSIS